MMVGIFKIFTDSQSVNKANKLPNWASYELTTENRVECELTDVLHYTKCLIIQPRWYPQMRLNVQ